MKTKLFITGSSGFIGFHVAKRYLDKGFKVYGFDSMNNYYDVNLKRSRSVSYTHLTLPTKA